MAKHSLCVLCVDDEVKILNTFKRILRNEPYTLMITDNVKDALDLIEKNNINLIITDYRMPEIDGLTFCKTVRERYKDIKVILLSGYTDPNILNNIPEHLKPHKYILKPWDDEKLKEEIENCLSMYTHAGSLFK